tara:strand:- start:145 stop:516 length:372 start_codon:yes stop_codon:yes gene_type:complete
MRAEIVGLTAKKSRAGAEAVQIEIRIDQGLGNKALWVREWIGSTAPDWVIDRWRDAINMHPLEAMRKGNAWSIIGKAIDVTTKESEYGPKLDDWRWWNPANDKAEDRPAQTQQPKAVPDDVPF